MSSAEESPQDLPNGSSARPTIGFFRGTARPRSERSLSPLLDRLGGYVQPEPGDEFSQDEADFGQEREDGGRSSRDKRDKRDKPAVRGSDVGKRGETLSPARVTSGDNRPPTLSRLDLSEAVARCGPLARVVEELALSVQVDPLFSLVATLGVAGSVVGLSTNVVAGSWSEPAILQWLVVAPASEGKTATLAPVAEALYRLDRERREAQAEEEERAYLDSLGAKPADPGETSRLRDAALARRVVAAKGTPEALEVLAARQGERRARLVLITAEGRGLFGDLSRYRSGGPPNLDLLVNGYDGTFYDSFRLTRTSVAVEELRVPLLVMLQPRLWADLASDPLLADAGVLARLCPVRPPSLVGSRAAAFTERAYVLPPLVEEAWDGLLARLYAQAFEEDEPLLSVLDRASLKRIEQAWATWEPYLGRLRDEDAGEVWQQWAGRQIGRVLRLAGVVHALRTGRLGGNVTAEEVEIALALADWLAAEAHREYGGSILSRDARRLVRYLSEEAGDEELVFEAREAYRALHWGAERFTTAADELAGLGALEPCNARRSVWRWLGEPAEGLAADDSVCRVLSRGDVTTSADVSAGQGPCEGEVSRLSRLSRDPAIPPRPVAQASTADDDEREPWEEVF